MIDFEKELASILDNDPLGLLNIKPKASSVISADDRLIASFKEINTFIEEFNHEPVASRDIKERKLFSRLKGLRDNPEKMTVLLDLDRFNLFSAYSLQTKTAEPIDFNPETINTISDILEDDVLGLLGEPSNKKTSYLSDSDDIFTIKNIPLSTLKAMEMPDKVARRKPCPDFEKFEPLFKQCHADLKSGTRETRKFSGEQQITAGHFFVLHGVIIYVESVGDKKKKNGKVNAKLRCIFENGTESNMLLRSLATELYKDETGRRILDLSDITNETGLTTDESVTNEQDVATGYIYILRSLSSDPKIKEIEDLYKIGFSTTPVEQRIQNAEYEPTYLMAKVRLVTEFETFNLNPQKLELLLHTFFAESCLNIDIYDGKNKRHMPREWFIVPLHVIETAVQLLINGEIVNYSYNHKNQEIISRE